MFNENYINPTGHFKLITRDAITKDILDVEDDRNMIVVNSRSAIAKLFVGLSSSKNPTKFLLGNCGSTPYNKLIAKTASEGFVKSRTALFAEDAIVNVNTGTTIDVVIGDKISYKSKNYEIITAGSHIVTDATITDTDTFVWLEFDPEAVHINFVTDGATGNTPSNVGTVTTSISGTAVTISLELASGDGNGQTGNMHYTEAGIYCGDDLFCMKTFPVKVKDETVTLTLEWTITF